MGKNNNLFDEIYPDDYWDTLCDISYDFDGFDDLYGGFGIDEKENDDYLRIKRIEYKTGMEYDDFLKLDVLEQMKLCELLDLHTPNEKEEKYKNKLNKKQEKVKKLIVKK